MLCSASAKLNVASDMCLVFAVWTRLFLISSFVNNFEQAYYDILFSLKSLFHFLVPVVDSTYLQEYLQQFYKMTLKIPGKSNK